MFPEAVDLPPKSGSPENMLASCINGSTVAPPPPPVGANRKLKGSTGGGFSTSSRKSLLQLGHDRLEDGDMAIVTVRLH